MTKKELLSQVALKIKSSLLIHGKQEQDLLKTLPAMSITDLQQIDAIVTASLAREDKHLAEMQKATTTFATDFNNFYQTNLKRTFKVNDEKDLDALEQTINSL